MLSSPCWGNYWWLSSASAARSEFALVSRRMNLSARHSLQVMPGLYYHCVQAKTRCGVPLNNTALKKKKKKSCRFCCHIFLCNLTFQVSQLICSQLYSGLLRCIKLLMVINEKIITPNSTSHVLLYYYLNLDCTVEADDLWNTGRFQWETSVHYPFLSPRIQLDIQHWAAK